MSRWRPVRSGSLRLGRSAQHGPAEAGQRERHEADGNLPLIRQLHHGPNKRYKSAAVKYGLRGFPR
jgi:hypothetical protein